MMKRLLIQQQYPVAAEENMSNLTSASGEASVSSNQQSFVSQNPDPNPSKKKRKLPGNPDPDADVIALSPKTLMEKNRFVCEICNKGFQRDQNLQLHRRGHNLPWKLKQRTGKEVVRKRVYVCPEKTCIHHDPARALGDLTGIKKHFYRKHGEKKWKCDKCSKKYAVQSDWKAHAKTCGTREYRCDCGTLFSRRDSFITHRAFCDALAEESAKAQTTAAEELPAANPGAAEEDGRLMTVASSSSSPSSVVISSVLPLQPPPPPAEQPPQEPENMKPAAILQHMPAPQLPLVAPAGNTGGASSSSSGSSGNNSSTSASLFASLFASAAASATQSSSFSDLMGAMTRNDRGGVAPPSSVAAAAASLETTSLCLSRSGSTLFSAPLDRRPLGPPLPSSPHMSATALLQKAAQMGATATNSSLLRGFGLAARHPHESLQENYPWRVQQFPAEEAATGLSAGLGLGLPYDSGSGGLPLPNLVMGQPSFFGAKPATLDLLGLGMGPGGAPTGGLSALITSIGGGGYERAAASTAAFGGGSAPGKAWEGADRTPGSSTLL
uniref:Protein EARLY HEADING DATE 2 n=1 Tax=Anthurium amnicola TaxID=1678845 RepID=A0A1D1Y8G9_9ARAE